MRNISDIIKWTAMNGYIDSNYANEIVSIKWAIIRTIIKDFSKLRGGGKDANNKRFFNERKR